ncbi:zinc finger BED domain-containing protein 5-like [Chanodichthys erythropterus]|uniref:zinc finger BED domain-containing protein 5-like n=1 Tax=Chanodichthys erythropterus TaxID=933992 RepID=UPI00351F14EA
MSSAGVGPQCFIHSRVNAVVYQEILEYFMLPSADKLYGDADFLFQQDLPIARTAKEKEKGAEMPADERAGSAKNTEGREEDEPPRLPSTTGRAARQTHAPQMDHPSSKARKYREEYINYGFTCIVINQKELQGQKKVLIKQTTIPTKAQRASYEVAYLIAQTKKPHNIGETLIKPAAIAMSHVMHGDKLAAELEQVPLSDGTVSRRITEMAQDIKCQLIDRVKKSGRYALQLDESTDVSSTAQLLVFVRYIFEGKLNEEMLFCTQLEGSCTGEDIFNKLDSKLKDEGLSWGECISVCTDGAGAMLGKKKGLKARVLQVAPHLNFTHCIIHREALACKTLNAEFKHVLDTSVKIVNYIKSRPLNTRLFSTLCNEMGSEHKGLLLHTEVRWLSRGNVLRRLYELRDEVRIFLTDQRSPLAEHLSDPDWVTRLAYLSCIFEKLNGLNVSLQGENTNILYLNDKVQAFARKLVRWRERVEMGRIDMFPELEEFMEENALSVNSIKASITAHLQSLLDHFHKYFPEGDAPDQYDWIRSL